MSQLVVLRSMDEGALTIEMSDQSDNFAEALGQSLLTGTFPLTATLEALATECRTLRGMVAATPRRWWRPAMAINLAPPKATPHRWAFLRAFWRVRRDVWSERESRLVAKWESYG